MLDSDVFQRSISDVIYFITSTAKKTSDLERKQDRSTVCMK